jgi:hypothetical protein
MSALSNPWGFVNSEGHRWWTDPKQCPHSNENICQTCDFDGYYAANYATCPWGDKAADGMNPDKQALS